MKRLRLSRLVVGAVVGLMLVAAACSSPEETYHHQIPGSGKADGLSLAQRAPSMEGWSLVPTEELTEAWLVPNHVVLRFQRQARSGIDHLGNQRSECEALVAANAQVIVLQHGIPYTSETSQFAVSVTNVIDTGFGGGGEEANVAFDNLTFAGSWSRPGSGESGWIANVPEFGIISRCSGSAYSIRQRSSVTRTYADGSTAKFDHETMLSGVFSIDPQSNLSPPATCETMSATGLPDGAVVERCAGAPRDPADLGYSQLSVTLRQSDVGGLVGLKFGQSYSVWLSLNQVEGFYPMVCRSHLAYPTQTWICQLTVTTEKQEGLLYQDGPVVDNNLFTWARRDGGTTLNAWDIQFAAVDQNGNWVNNGGHDYRGRIAEQQF